MHDPNLSDSVDPAQTAHSLQSDLDHKCPQKVLKLCLACSLSIKNNVQTLYKNLLKNTLEKDYGMPRYDDAWKQFGKLKHC